ncbi:MAG TPA: PilZ domain-containing protein [Gemmatimonadales bacterium]|nr:PilZ domain-containing protein [Gemmatimonadales bacterium]
MEVPRRSPRLSFTGRVAPRLVTESRSYEIVDLSPEGLRFRTSTVAPTVTIGAVLRAVIQFPASRSVEVAGRVLRVEGVEAAVELESGQEELAERAPMGPASPPRIGMLW